MAHKPSSSTSNPQALDRDSQKKLHPFPIPFHRFLPSNANENPTLMSSPPPPPVAVVEEETTEVDMDDDNQWEESEDDDDNQWEEEPEDDENVDEEVDEGRRGSAGVSAEDVAAMVEEHTGVEIESWPTCCVCMESWTSDGAHRICCLPCGHVYGRSCLEKWLHRCGNTSAKCPQCARQFGHKHITNLHVSGNVLDYLCRLKSMIQELEARLAVNNKKIEQLRVDALSNEENQQLKAQLAVAERFLVDIRSEVAEEHAKLRAELKLANAKLRAEMESRFESIQQSCWEEAAQDAAAVVQAEFLSIKEQLRKMADQQNATPVDLLRFMDQNGAKLWQAIRSRPPAAMSASTGAMGNYSYSIRNSEG